MPKSWLLVWLAKAHEIEVSGQVPRKVSTFKAQINPTCSLVPGQRGAWVKECTNHPVWGHPAQSSVGGTTNE